MEIIRILYLENSYETMEAFEDYFMDRIDFDFVDNIVAFDEFLFSEDEFYDLVIIDLSVNINSTLEDLCKNIIEFVGKDIPTKVRGTLTLIGYDYIKYVMRYREKTIRMIKEGRVVVISGHIEIMKKENLLLDEVFQGIPFFDRAYTSIKDIDREIRRVIGG